MLTTMSPGSIMSSTVNSLLGGTRCIAMYNRRAAPNKQLQRTVIRHRGDGASAPFHYALAPRITRQRAAAELRR